MTILRTKKNQSYHPLFTNFFESPFLNESTASNDRFNFSLPAINIKESEDGFKIEVMAPGFSKENITINVKNNVLSLSGNIETSEEVIAEKFTRKEFSMSSFERSFTLPSYVESEKIEAKYENGILHVSIPKKIADKSKTERMISIS